MVIFFYLAYDVLYRSVFLKILYIKKIYKYLKYLYLK
jgi:hypothetical protein